MKRRENETVETKLKRERILIKGEGKVWEREIEWESREWERERKREWENESKSEKQENRWEEKLRDKIRREVKSEQIWMWGTEQSQKWHLEAFCNIRIRNKDAETSTRYKNNNREQRVEIWWKKKRIKNISWTCTEWNTKQWYVGGLFLCWRFLVCFCKI